MILCGEDKSIKTLLFCLFHEKHELIVRTIVIVHVEEDQVIFFGFDLILRQVVYVRIYHFPVYVFFRAEQANTLKDVSVHSKCFNSLC